MTLWAQVGLGFGGAAALMLALWLYAQARRDATIVDVGWTLGLGLLAIWYAATSDGVPARRGLVAALTGIWAARLAGYLLLHRVVGKPEDGRYQALRKRWGDRAAGRFFVLFQAQAVLAMLFSLPMLALTRSQRPALDTWDFAGIGLWLIAVGGEATADAQLARFRRQPEHRGRTCRAGLWRYSRHPNYFFEWLHWGTYVLLGIGENAAWWTSLGWCTLLGPPLMLLFLFRLTGIPYTEAQALRSRGDDYRRYQQSTSAFVPWFPREV